MSDVYTHVTHNSLGDNLFRSIKGFLVGVLLFLIAFPILWMNEGRTDMSTVAKTATVVSATQPGATGEGTLISTTGALGVEGSVGDLDMLVPGNYVMLSRKVEAFVWKEKKDTHTQKKLGGGSETITTYSYDLAWTDSPQDEAAFAHPEGHENPSIDVAAIKLFAPRATVGSFGFDPSEAELPAPTALALTPAMVVGHEPPKPAPKAVKGKPAKGAKKAAAVTDDEDEAPRKASARDFRLASGVLYRGVGSPIAPQLGDVRVTYEALAPGAQVTLYGERHGATITPFLHEGSDRLFRAVAGTHEQAIGTLHGEHVATTWALRILGFFCMWIGLALLLAPFHAMLDIIPFIGSAGRFVTGLVMGPIAFVVSSVVIVLAIVAHSPILLVLVLLLLVGGLVGFLVMRNEKKNAQASAALQSPALAGGFAPNPQVGRTPYGQPPNG